MYFCQDVDLMAWEPGIFLETAFAHQTLMKNGAGTLGGTVLTISSGDFSGISAGMVIQVSLGDGSLTQMLEVQGFLDSVHAVVSGLRGRSSESLITPIVNGSVTFTVVTVSGRRSRRWGMICSR